MNMESNHKVEELQKKLIDEAYAMAFTGMSATILSINEIESADFEELKKLAKAYFG